MSIIWGEPDWIDTILLRIQSALRAGSLGIASDLVFLYEGEPTDLLEKPPGDTFLAVAPMSLPVSAGFVAGGGAPHTVYDGRFRVDLMRRVSDQQHRGGNLLTRSGESIAGFARRVINAMQEHTLAVDVDGVTSTPLIEPMRLVSLDFNPRRPAQGWSWARSVWSVKFREAHGPLGNLPGESYLTGTFNLEGVYP